MMHKKAVLIIVLLASLSLFGQSKPVLDDLKKQAIVAIDARQVLTQQMVDQVFSFAELGFQEHETSKYVTDILQKDGFTVDRGVAGIPTAWVATYGSRKPTIAFIQRFRLHSSCVAETWSRVSRSHY